MAGYGARVRDRGPSNAEVAAKCKEYLFPSAATYYDEPVALESGTGMRVRDYDGRTYLDFFGGILTVSVGHANSEVNARVRGQMDRLGHVSTLYPTLPIGDLAEKLVQLAPLGLGKAFFCTSGTEANETAVTLAQTHTGEAEIVALRHGYSGRTIAAQALTGNSKYRPVTTQLAGVKHAHAPYCYRCPFGLRYPSCALKCAEDIEELIQTTTAGHVGAIIIEPILGVGGFITPPDGWLRLAVDVVRKYGGVFICDEVQTGFGRTGKMWGIDHEGVEPDVMTMAKGIANGYPLGAVLAKAPIAASWKAGNISTFGGNPISCAAAAATIGVIESENLVHNAAAMGEILRQGLDALKAKHSAIGDVRGRGLMQGIEIVRNEKEHDRTPDVEITLSVFEEAKKRGLLVGRGGLYGNVLRIAPPLIVGRRDVDDAHEILDASLAAAGR